LNEAFFGIPISSTVGNAVLDHHIHVINLLDKLLPHNICT